MSVTADVDANVVAAGDVIADLTDRILPDILMNYPNVFYSFEGQAAEQRDSIDGLKRGFIIALFVIFTLLAVPLKSYIQPLIHHDRDRLRTRECDLGPPLHGDQPDDSVDVRRGASLRLPW